MTKFNTFNKLFTFSALAIFLWLLTVLPIESFGLKQTTCASLKRSETVSTQPAIPDLQQIAALALGGGGGMLTEAQIAEEQQIEIDQVEQAGQWLEDVDVHQRVSGAEQLAAYPTATAEGYLIKALQQDSEGEVRAAAAESLSAIKTPKIRTFDVLLSALADNDEDVGFKALNSIQSLLNRIADNAKLRKQVELKLKRQMKSGHLPSQMREAIKDYLLDLETS